MPAPQAAPGTPSARLGIILPLLILLLAVWLRAPAPWSAAPLDVDEALYASYGRQISHENNPLLADTPIDKPPLYFYILAASFKLFGQPSAWAARLPAFFASLLTVAAVWRLTLATAQDRRVAGLAALIVALSPLDITHAGTVFVDPLVTLWIVLALLATSRQRWALNGTLAALAFATKQSALIYLPLVVGVGLYMDRPRAGQLRNFALAYGLICVLPFAWDAARPGMVTGWWALGEANNAPERLIRAAEVVPRLQCWASYLSSAAGSAWGLGATGIGALALLWPFRKSTPVARTQALDLIWLAYSLAYSLLYSLVAFNLYPRYAHLLTVPLAILAARVLSRLGAIARHRPIGKLLLVGMLLIWGVGLPHTFSARSDPAWLRPARERHAGIEAAAAYLNTLPPGTIVYDHWVGWLLGWYVGQTRPPNMWLRTVYYPTPEQLITGALAQPDSQPRFFVVPAWSPAAPWLAALEARGFAPQLVATPGQFGIYRILPP